VIGVSRTGAPDTGADEMAPISALDDILKRSDAVMISLPLDKATHHLINARTLALCKKNAIIVNIARGGIIDQLALTEALKAGTIAGAAIDVTDPEPLPPEHPLWDAPNLYISPHLAGAAGSMTTDRISSAAASNLERFRRGEALNNVVRL
jgi:phosphoglycerate dehydrogenase-like enzyme